MEKLEIGIIGLGQRGRGLMTNILNINYVQITAICDIFDDRIDAASERIVGKGDPEPLKTKDYMEVINSGVQAVIVATGWSNHVQVALACMKAGITVAMEVGGTHSIDDCWKLVDCYEQTKTPFMFLENCCYNKDEVLVTSLVRNGVLGEVVHCSGEYGHDLREEIAGGIDTHHYRLEEYKHNNCDNYPTHELGPIAKILNINRGNRFVSLVSMSSKAVGMERYVQKTDKYKDRLKGVKFLQGDVTTTMISCENGETICLKLDTTLPRLYDRALTVSGTEGWYNQTTQLVV
ncbi:MAG: Gfo/Idh/MocA family protein, partial [Candidatus Fimimonas sp.]